MSSPLAVWVRVGSGLMSWNEKSVRNGEEHCGTDWTVGWAGVTGWRRTKWETLGFARDCRIDEPMHGPS